MSTDTAIQTDVVDVGEKGTDVAENVFDTEKKSVRSEIMDQIVKKRRQELDQEIEEDLPAEESFEEKIAVAEPEPVKEPERLTVKIDGEERKVTEAEIREYQKQVAADKRLEEAAALRRSLEERQAAIEARERELEARRTVEVEDDIDPSVLAEDLIESVTMEDKERTTEIIKKLRGKKDVAAIQQAPAVDPRYIDSAVTAALDRKEQAKAVERFNSEFPELATRPGFRAEVNARTIEEWKIDPAASYWDVIERAANHVKRELSSVFGVKQEARKSDPVKEALEARAEKKRVAADSVKSGVSARAPSETVSRPVLTPFQQLQKARGQLSS
jgi:hypothetical protein